MRIFFSIFFVIILSIQTYANNVVNDTINKAQKDGFELIKQYKTILGRTVLELESKSHIRQIVINPTNGLIMRDFREKKHNKAENDSWFGRFNDSFFGEGSESGSDDE